MSTVAVVSRNYEKSIPNNTFNCEALTNFRENELSTLSLIPSFPFFEENYISCSFMHLNIKIAENHRIFQQFGFLCWMRVCVRHQV